MTGAVSGGLYLVHDHLGSTNTLVLSDLGNSGALSAGKHARRESPSPRYTTRTVKPTPTATPTGKPATGTVLLDRTAVVERRQAEERKAAAERAARAAERLALSDPKAYAAGLAAKQGWDSDQVSCLDTLWDHESGWRTNATNPSSGAYGIPQALPGDRMATYGSDWRTNPQTQIKWGINYIADRYSTPCGAWSFWRANGWY